MGIDSGDLHQAWLGLGVPHPNDEHEDRADTGFNNTEEEAVSQDARVCLAGRRGEHDDRPDDCEC